MVCPKCKNENVSIQVITENELKTKHHSFIWWLCIGWWFVPIMWVCFFWLKIILKVFHIEHKKQKIVNIQKKVSVCQNCGHTW